MRQIKLKKSESRRIELKDGDEIIGIAVIDYPTIEQQDFIDEIYHQYMKPAYEIAANLRRQNPEISPDEVNSLTAGHLDPKKLTEWKRLIVRCSLKELENTDEPLVLDEHLDGKWVNENQFNELVKDRYFMGILFDCILPEVGFSSVDKKK